MPVSMQGAERQAQCRCVLDVAGFLEERRPRAQRSKSMLDPKHNVSKKSAARAASSCRHPVCEPLRWR
eukprot:scaffold1166_cov261-Pinguiococcus_pyrenoidosus.AAC.66